MQSPRITEAAFSLLGGEAPSSKEKDPDLGGVMPRLVGFSRFAALPESRLARRYASAFSPVTKR
jgi:hypothetical protein